MKKNNTIMKDERVKILYTNYFEYTNKAESEMMGGHPKEGQVYRAVWYEPLKSYRLYVAEDNPDTSALGVYLKNFEETNPWVNYSFTEVTEDTMKDLDLNNDQVDRILDWMNIDHDDIIPTEEQMIEEGGLVDGLDNDEDEEEYYEERMSLTEFFDALKDAANKRNKQEESDEIKEKDAEKETFIEDNLSVIKKADKEFYNAIDKLVTYLASTCSEKYAKADISTKDMLYSENYGKGFNMGNALKYVSRYCTEDFSKSNNIQDLFKAIHYSLFEITRRNIIKK